MTNSEIIEHLEETTRCLFGHKMRVRAVNKKGTYTMYCVDCLKTNTTCEQKVTVTPKNKENKEQKQ